MELVMTKSFEDRFFEMIDDRFKRQDERADKQDLALAKILTQAQKTNGRVTKLEGEKGKKLSLSNPILYLIALATVMVLAIVATSMGINLKGIL